MTAFIEEHRDAYGVEPICRVLPIAPSTYYTQAARKADPERRPNRAWKDDALSAQIRRVFDENRQVYGVRKVWRQLLREGYRVARCTVARLMKRLGLAGVVRGKGIKTTHSDKAAPCPRDQVNRQFKAARPNALWVRDFTYVSTWQGFVYVAFVIDVLAEVIHRRSWPNRETVELATLSWVDWFNHKRLLGPIGNIPPAEAEAAYHQRTRELAMAA